MALNTRPISAEVKTVPAMTCYGQTFTLEQVEVVFTADVAGIVAVPSLLLAGRARISESAQILGPLYCINRSKTGKNACHDGDYKLLQPYQSFLFTN